ncbi:lambda-exonuclease family protein [Streptosporangium sp. NPDC051023]|uniref:YqaJ viral recombinase family nuclease n=1 Tax=Streptosporangium sp. NPDC051023 TaxID=3155410 RepID=UPI00344BF91E
MTSLITPTARLLAPAGLSREEWLEVRRTGVGGSDVAAILGMDAHRGPLHVYLSKRGELAERRDPRLDRAARRGHKLEGLVAELFEEESGHGVLQSPGTLQHTDRPWMLANCDRLVVESATLATWSEPHPDIPLGPGYPDATAVLECKSRTWRSARREDWHGEEPPDGPALQAYWYLAVTGYPRAYVAGLIDDDLAWFRLERDEELIGHLVQLVTEFWERHVLAGVEPDPGDLEATDELLGHLWDVRPESVKFFAGAEVAEIEALVTERDAIVAQRKELKRDLGRIENRLKAKLGPNEIAEVALAPGRELYSWHRNGVFASKRFREAEPDLAAEYVHLVKAIDRERLAAEKPDVYGRHRARVFRTPGGSS